MKHTTSVLRATLVATIVLLAGGVDGPRSAAAQERPTFRASVALVPITAVVRDSRSRIVRNLARDDFQVLENNEPRQILDFVATEQSPVSLAILVDSSGSMRGRTFETALAIVSHLVRQLDVTADEAALFTFDHTIRQETPFTSDAAMVRAALERSDAWGLTSLYDAIAETARELSARPSSRRAVVVITDGLDTSSVLTAPDVSGLASAIDVPVYVMSVAPPPRTAAPSAPSSVGLSQLALWTGGHLRHVASAADMASAIGGLMGELRQQYFLAIESSAASGWHRLDVTTKRRDLTVRARSGYFAAH